MGVPAFFRWISEKFPKIVVEMLEKRKAIVDGFEMPLNLLEPNPNGLEFDNLYIDMNGLIHPCSHPEDREAPTSEAEMYLNVSKYIDRLFAAVRPRRVLFLAIDGVAPRAKMNQQRARRFRAAQEAKERQKMMEDVMQEMKELGLAAPPGKGGPEWDSNVITPGTEFMYSLSLFMRYYILDRMNKDPAWRSIKVILSDASEPGEGEHKIMKFIRSQRAQPGYDPNQRHILHGLDADLIMLALATHEPHFTILRELVTFGKKDRDKPKSEAMQLLQAQGMQDAAAASSINPEDEWVFSKPLQALHVNILREYLQNEFNCLEMVLPFPYDFERVVDDFVFLCFFVGNDFLPHLPSLDIRDGALDFLIQVYKDLLPSLGDYLTYPGGNVNLRQVDVILGKVGEVEDVVFQRRKTAEDEDERRNQMRKLGGHNQHGGRGGGGGGRGSPRAQSQFPPAPPAGLIPVKEGKQMKLPPPPPPPTIKLFLPPGPEALLLPGGRGAGNSVAGGERGGGGELRQSSGRPAQGNSEAASRLKALLSKRPRSEISSSEPSTPAAAEEAVVTAAGVCVDIAIESVAASTDCLSVMAGNTPSCLDGESMSLTEGSSLLVIQVDGQLPLETASDSLADVQDSIDSTGTYSTVSVIHSGEERNKKVPRHENDVDVIESPQKGPDLHGLISSSAGVSVVETTATVRAGSMELAVAESKEADESYITSTSTVEFGADVMVEELADADDDVDDLDRGDMPPASSLKVPVVLVKAEGAELAVMTPEEMEHAKEEIKKRLKAKEGEMLDKYKESLLDHVRLHEQGWKDRYYGDPPKRDDLQAGGGLARMCFTYVQGLCWVLKYYYEGCPSWNWYYPFHYAPFASDLRNIDRYHISFELAEPFRPIEQLLAVLPAESVQALPEPCRGLMIDEDSEIKDLYVSDAPIDPNGKHLPWLWVLLLPFIDETRITAAFQHRKAALNLIDRRRNALGGSLIFVSTTHPLAQGLETAKFEYRPGPEDDAEVSAALWEEVLSASKGGGGWSSSDGTDELTTAREVDDDFFAQLADAAPASASASVPIVVAESQGTGSQHMSGSVETEVGGDMVVSVVTGETPTSATTTSGELDIMTLLLTGGSVTGSEAVEVERGQPVFREPEWCSAPDYAKPYAKYFDQEIAQGICGVVAPPPPEWFARLQSPLGAPEKPFGAFTSIHSNKVMCMKFLFPPERAYDCSLLPGLVPPPIALTPLDLVPRRPPRLNRGKFNIVDLAAGFRQGGGGSGGGGSGGSWGHQGPGRGGDYGGQGHGYGYGQQGGDSSPWQQQRHPQAGYGYELGLAASQRMITAAVGPPRAGFDRYPPHGYATVPSQQQGYRGGPPSTFSGSQSHGAMQRDSYGDGHGHTASRFDPPPMGGRGGYGAPTGSELDRNRYTDGGDNYGRNPSWGNRSARHADGYVVQGGYAQPLGSTHSRDFRSDEGRGEGGPGRTAGGFSHHASLTPQSYQHQHQYGSATHSRASASFSFHQGLGLGDRASLPPPQSMQAMRSQLAQSLSNSNAGEPFRQPPLQYQQQGAAYAGRGGAGQHVPDSRSGRNYPGPQGGRGRY